jgi:deoxyribodipyrimidine photolyase-related protein
MPAKEAATASSISRIVFLPFDQLNLDHGVLPLANKKTDLILLVESQRMVDPDRFHPMRLFFLVSSAQHFADELKSAGYRVEYLQAATTEAGILATQKKCGVTELFAATQSSYRLQATLEKLGAQFCENEFYLTPRALFEEWAGGQKSLLMENFYRLQRKRLNILMTGNSPVGGEWNFDKENRESLPKDHQVLAPLEHAPDEIDTKVAQRFGISQPKYWATTRTGALAALEFFLTHHFVNFGRYEDAMSSGDWAVHHSLLSPYINIGLLHPQEVVDAAVARFEVGDIPIASAEAFVRQIIGWREYINGMYWHFGESYRDTNQLQATRKLLPLFEDSSKTQMNCLSSIVKDVEERAWVHHIPRLMVLSNLALISGVNPQEYLAWMRSQFIDASDWVMVPNVIGMGVHADGGAMMTKPYAAGGAYISRMSNYCKSCSFDPKKRVGQDACPFTTLYWNFLAEHREEFSKNHRMFQQLSGLTRLSDLDEVRQRAAQVLAGLEAGTL